MILGKLNLKPVMVNQKDFDDLSIEEIELIFGYEQDYTALRLEDLKVIIEQKKLEDLTVKEFQKILMKTKNRDLCKTERLKRLGKGFCIHSFCAILMTLTRWFK